MLQFMGHMLLLLPGAPSLCHFMGHSSQREYDVKGSGAEDRHGRRDEYAHSHTGHTGGLGRREDE